MDRSDEGSRRGTLLRLLAVLAAVPALGAAPAHAGPPPAGVLVPGQRLGGLELGATKARVERTWGRAYGVCPRCERQTWYFNLYAFQPRGAAVEFRRERVVAIFTVYQPLGWRTRDGLGLGDPAGSVSTRHPGVRRTDCPGGYYALVLQGGTTTTAFYVLGERVWAFGLQRPDVPVCR